MKSRKFIPLALVAIFLINAQISASAFYEVRANSECPKVGKTAVVGTLKYFCLQKRKNDGSTYQVWSKGVNYPESPSKKLSVRNIALDALKAWYEKQPVRTDRVNAHIDPDLDPKIRELFLTYAEDAFRFWGKEFLPDATMFVGAATSWYVKEQCDYYKSINDPNLNYSNCLKRSTDELAGGSGWPNQEPDQLNANGAVYGPITVFSEPRAFYPSPLYIFLSSLENKSSLNIGAVVQHELTHIAQWDSYGVDGSSSARAEYFQRKSWSGNLNYKMVMSPILWVEGSAYYFGNSLGELRNPGILERDMSAKSLSYLSSRSKEIDFLLSEPFPYIGPNMTQAQNDEKNDFYMRRYIVGGLMTELMCAKFGMAKCMEFNNTWAAGAYEPSATFQTAFEKHFSTPWDIFAKATNLYVSDVIAEKPTPLSKYL